MANTPPLRWIVCLVLCLITILSIFQFNTVPVSYEYIKTGFKEKDPLTICLTDAQVSFLGPDSADWAEEISTYNLRLPYTPAAVAIPKDVDQIQASVLCGVQNNVRVSAKGGGHSFGSYGLGGEDGHLVIALDRMNEVKLGENGIATIQAGARVGHVALELFNQGQRGIAHGECPSVGITGHVLHGGLGMASRTYGLTLDWLVGAKVVLANGTIASCSSTENEDLFWALRGAGSSFGIVAELEFDTFEVPEEITSFSLNFRWTEEEAVAGFKALQDLMVNAPKELNLLAYLAPTGQTIHGVYYGDQKRLNAALKPFLDDTDGRIESSHRVTWIKSLEQFGYGTPLNQATTLNEHRTFYASSLLAPALTKQQIESLMSSLFANSNDPMGRHSWVLMLEFSGGENSVIPDIPPSETSYFHRDKLFVLQFTDNIFTKDSDERFSQVNGFRESITKTMADGDWGMYANYIDTELDSEKAQELYYGGNLERLRKIKGDLDPTEVFWNPQGISPAASPPQRRNSRQWANT
ncbi:hypothetical protein AK830_g10562 [Neonectria ditissima]|uniref:FAD-binding PCMH-type domain-containing protein n=1 Tax=Neonectria ditissima TaxID=78410 RepID=A0A0P7AT97_9HYPO|nr:hypothetical protein AK830_g10562 [Neonectria ditissima]